MKLIHNLLSAFDSRPSLIRDSLDSDEGKHRLGSARQFQRLGICDNVL